MADREKPSRPRDEGPAPTKRTAEETAADAGTAEVRSAAPLAEVRTDSVDLAAFQPSFGDGADITGQLDDGAQSFGAILRSVGKGIVASQKALDKGLIASAKKLSDTKVKIVRQVVQRLGDDGLPVKGKTDLVVEEVSLSNYIRPATHQWHEVNVCIDLEVGAIDRDSGFKVTHKQSSGGFGVSGSKVGWSFDGWYRSSSSTTTVDRSSESDWSRGRLLVDGRLGRRDAAVEPPTEVVIGPQISIAQGATTLSENEDRRELAVTVTVRKANGSANPNRTIEVVSRAFSPEFVSGNTTNASGTVDLRLVRRVPKGSPAVGDDVVFKLGNMSRTKRFTL